MANDACFLCGESWTTSGAGRRKNARKPDPVISHVVVMNAWKERCVVSTCRILRIPVSHPGMEVLLRAEKYCGECVQLMRDVEFSVGAMDKLQRQIRSLRQTLLTKLNAHWDLLQHSPRKKTSARQRRIPNPQFAVVFEKVQEEFSSWTDFDFRTFENAGSASKESDPPNHLTSEVLEVIKEEPFEHSEVYSPEESKVEFFAEDHPDSQLEQLGVLANNEVAENEAICPVENPSGSNSPSELNSDSDWAPNSDDELEYGVEVINSTGSALELTEEKTDEPLKNNERETLPRKPFGTARRKKKSNIGRRRKSKCPQPLNKRSVYKTLCPNGCVQKFHSRIGLEEHVRQIHSSVYPCKHCDKKLASLDGYEQHLLRHLAAESKKGQRACVFCGIWLKLEEIDEHEGQHRSREFPFSCLICEDTKFLGVAPLTKHMNEVHPLKALICEECGKVYLNLNSLKRHISTIHCKNTQNHECSECGKVFPQDFLLKRHKRCFHSHCVCDICGKSFMNVNTFEVHRQSHSKDLTYKCPLCDRSFNGSKKLTRHQQIHAGVKFQCPDCPKTFATKRYLIQHARCHLPRELRKYYYKTKPTSTNPAKVPEAQNQQLGESKPEVIT